MKIIFPSIVAVTRCLDKGIELWSGYERTMGLKKIEKYLFEDYIVNGKFVHLKPKCSVWSIVCFVSKGGSIDRVSKERNVEDYSIEEDEYTQSHSRTHEEL